MNTNEDKRDAHLRSADFFDVEQHEHITFDSKSIVPVGDDTFEITGDLTLHGVTREITLKAEVRAPRRTRGATSAWASRSPVS